MEPPSSSFTSDFALCLACNLLGPQHVFAKIHERIQVFNKLGRKRPRNSSIEPSFRLYWRTPLNHLSHETTANQDEKKEEESDIGVEAVIKPHVHYIDVTWEFKSVHRQTQSSSSSPFTSTVSNTPTYSGSSIPCVELRFGALVSFPKSSDGHQYDSLDQIGAIYLQSDPWTIETLSKYAEEVTIDLSQTEPSQIARLLSKSLLRLFPSEEQLIELERQRRRRAARGLDGEMYSQSQQYTSQNSQDMSQISLYFSDESMTTVPTSRVQIKRCEEGISDYSLTVQFDIGLVHDDLQEEGTILSAITSVSPTPKSKANRTTFPSSIAGTSWNDIHHQNGVSCHDPFITIQAAIERMRGFISPSVLWMFLSNLPTDPIRVNIIIKKDGEHATKKTHRSKNSNPPPSGNKQSTKVSSLNDSKVRCGEAKDHIGMNDILDAVRLWCDSIQSETDANHENASAILETKDATESAKDVSSVRQECTLEESANSDGEDQEEDGETITMHQTINNAKLSKKRIQPAKPRKFGTAKMIQKPRRKKKSKCIIGKMIE